MLRLLTCVCALVLAIAAEAGSQPSGGAELFLKNCKTCHSQTDAGERRAGPHLVRVMARQGDPAIRRAIIEYAQTASSGGQNN